MNQPYRRDDSFQPSGGQFSTHGNNNGSHPRKGNRGNDRGGTYNRAGNNGHRNADQRSRNHSPNQEHDMPELVKEYLRKTLQDGRY